MKKEFLSPICHVIEIDPADILTTSGEDVGIDLDDFGFFDDENKTNLPGVKF